MIALFKLHCLLSFYTAKFEIRGNKRTLSSTTLLTFNFDPVLFTKRISDFSQCSWDKKIASLKGGEEGMPWIFIQYCCILLTDNSPKCQAIELYLWVGMLPQHKLGIIRPLQLLFQHRCRSKQQMKWCAFLFFNFFCHVSTTKGSNLTSDVISPLRIRK